MHRKSIADPVTALHEKIMNDDRYENARNLLLMHLTDAAFADVQTAVKASDDSPEAVISEMGGYSEIIKSNWGPSLDSTFSEVENYEHGHTSLREFFGYRQRSVVSDARSRLQDRVVNEL